MDPRSLDNTSASIADIVTADKLDAVSAGIVKDDESQSLSALSEKESALGKRTTHNASPSKERMRKSQGVGAVNADSDGASGAGDASAGTEKANAPSERLKVRQFLEREAISELDDTDEFEGAGSAYDAGQGTKRAIATVRDRKAKGAHSASGGYKGSSANAKATKSTSAQGAKKAKTTSARGVSQAQASHAAQAAGTAAKTAASSSGNAALAGTVGGSGLAAGGGVLCGVIAFVLVALVIGQIISALFGFWDAEDKKRSMEGLPPYITYEMVEEAVRCQQEYGHPAGCTIAQIICESGQGDSMSQLATRDHNLFGMKWAPSFAAAPEVAGKANWVTGEEVDGAHVTITDSFTVFKSDADSIKFRSRVFLASSTYSGNALIREAVSERSSDKMAEGLKDAGWATDSAYVEKLKAVMDRYGLRAFDAMAPGDLANPSAGGASVVAAAFSQLGVPYVWGGTTPGVGLDCSGLTQWCYRQAGISIPRNSEDQAAAGTKVPLSMAEPGDVLWRPGHVAIYIGDDSYIHEPQTGDVCKVSQGISYFTCALRFE